MRRWRNSKREKEVLQVCGRVLGKGGARGCLKVRWEEGSWHRNIGHPTKITNREMLFELSFSGKGKREREKGREGFTWQRHTEVAPQLEEEVARMRDNVVEMPMMQRVLPAAAAAAAVGIAWPEKGQGVSAPWSDARCMTREGQPFIRKKRKGGKKKKRESTVSPTKSLESKKGRVSHWSKDFVECGLVGKNPSSKDEPHLWDIWLQRVWLCNGLLQFPDCKLPTQVGDGKVRSFMRGLDEHSEAWKFHFFQSCNDESKIDWVNSERCEEDNSRLYDGLTASESWRGERIDV